MNSWEASSYMVTSFFLFLFFVLFFFSFSFSCLSFLFYLRIFVFFLLHDYFPYVFLLYFFLFSVFSIFLFFFVVFFFPFISFFLFVFLFLLPLAFSFFLLFLFAFPLNFLFLFQFSCFFNFPNFTVLKLGVLIVQFWIYTCSLWCWAVAGVLDVGYFIRMGISRSGKLWVSNIKLRPVVDLEEAFTTLCEIVKWSSFCTCTECAITKKRSCHKSYGSFFPGNRKYESCIYDFDTRQCIKQCRVLVIKALMLWHKLFTLILHGRVKKIKLEWACVYVCPNILAPGARARDLIGTVE